MLTQVQRPLARNADFLSDVMTTSEERTCPLMIHPRRSEMGLDGRILGCNRLQICGFLARFCCDLPIYLVDIVDVAMSPVQFETRHPPHEAHWSRQPSSPPAILLRLSRDSRNHDMCGAGSF